MQKVNVSETSKKDLSGPALRTFFNIAKVWDLSTSDQRTLLGHIPESTFFKWKKEAPGTLSHDTLERISYIIGIYKALQILLPTPQSADRWIKKEKNFTGCHFWARGYFIMVPIIQTIE